LPYQRLVTLAQRIALHIESLVPRGRARCLDIGSGDMTLVDAIQAQKPRSRTDWQCIDVRGSRPAAELKFADGEFDVALLCDVLHEAPEDAAQLLAEAARVARHVLVKDDFTREAFARLATEQRLYITALDADLDLDDELHVPGALLHRQGQFIAVLRSG
jgi:ubiquinone/menaquinone biosynthesis C-methylase UbiE